MTRRAVLARALTGALAATAAVAGCGKAKGGSASDYTKGGMPVPSGPAPTGSPATGAGKAGTGAAKAGTGGTGAAKAPGGR